MTKDWDSSPKYTKVTISDTTPALYEIYTIDYDHTDHTTLIGGYEHKDCANHCDVSNLDCAVATGESFYVQAPAASGATSGAPEVHAVDGSNTNSATGSQLTGNSINPDNDYIIALPATTPFKEIGAAGVQARICPCTSATDCSSMGF